MSNDNTQASDSFESDVHVAEQRIGDVLQLRELEQEELIDHENYLLVEALSILKQRAKKYGQVFTSVKDSALYFMLDLSGLEKEVFKVAYLNNKHCLITTETLAIGTINSAMVSIREIAKLALQHNASAILMAHNHPSGNTIPSQSDRELTRKVITALDLFEVRVLDHIVVADDTYHSMNERSDVDFHAEKLGCLKIS